jgi:hypothetical protein
MSGALIIGIRCRGNSPGLADTWPWLAGLELVIRLEQAQKNASDCGAALKMPMHRSSDVATSQL